MCLEKINELNTICSNQRITLHFLNFFLALISFVTDFTVTKNICSYRKCVDINKKTPLKMANNAQLRQLQIFQMEKNSFTSAIWRRM